MGRQKGKRNNKQGSHKSAENRDSPRSTFKGCGFLHITLSMVKGQVTPHSRKSTKLQISSIY